MKTKSRSELTGVKAFIRVQALRDSVHNGLEAVAELEIEAPGDTLTIKTWNEKVHSIDLGNDSELADLLNIVIDNGSREVQ